MERVIVLSSLTWVTQLYLEFEQGILPNTLLGVG